MAKRRLPVLPSSAQSEAPPRRRDAHWVALGAGLVVALWLPLVVAALWLSVRLRDLFGAKLSIASTLAIVAPLLLSYAFACLLGGAILRQAHEQLTGRIAALSGAVAGTFACSVALAQGNLTSWTVALASWITLAGTGALLTLLGARRMRR